LSTGSWLRGKEGPEDQRAERKKLEETIKEKARDGKIPCALCFKVAEESGVSRKEMGQVLNEIDVRISQCQLGCFE
jgi:hypothetical protein